MSHATLASSPARTSRPTPPRLKAEREGVVIASKGDTPTGATFTAALATFRMARNYGWDVDTTPFESGCSNVNTLDQMGPHVSEATRYLGAAATPDPDKYGFVFDSRTLFMRPRGFPTRAGVLYHCDEADFYGAERVALRIIMLARWCGKTVSPVWVDQAWRVNYDESEFERHPDDLFDTADGAIDWLNDHAPVGVEYDLTTEQSFGVWAR